MKLLYAAFRHDPLNPDAGSGADYQFHQALEGCGVEIRRVGPFTDPEPWPERFARRLYRAWSGRRAHKFPITLTRKASRATTLAVRSWSPDVVFTLFPATIAGYRGAAPSVLRLDTTFLGQEGFWPLYGALALRLSVRQERQSFAVARKLVTHSDWCRDSLIRGYGVDPEKIEVFPNPAALPESVVPPAGEPTLLQGLSQPLRLLLVGRDYARKGVGLALQIASDLRKEGIDCTLTVCGTDGPPTPGVQWAGSFSKRDPQQLEQYAQLFRNAHLLLHPAVFDASPIVPSEAAAFGVPTVTSAVGGVSTSVADGESGVVLPAGSALEAWVSAIARLSNDPDRYLSLRASTRRRYDRELNWKVAGNRLVSILGQALQANPISAVR